MSLSPLPASTTKHLTHLAHPLPRDLSVHLPLRQISSAPSGPSTGTGAGTSKPSAPASAAGPSSGPGAGAGGSRSKSDREGETQTASTGTTGTTLWLSAQILALYLASLPGPSTSAVPVPPVLSARANKGSSRGQATTGPQVPDAGTTRLAHSAVVEDVSGPKLDNHEGEGTAAGAGTDDLADRAKGKGAGRVLELGAGTGYVALCLASMGWGVTTTDIEPVLSAVLRPNVDSGRRTLRAHMLESEVEVRGLDWVGVGEAWMAGGGGEVDVGLSQSREGTGVMDGGERSADQDEAEKSKERETTRELQDHLQHLNLASPAKQAPAGPLHRNKPQSPDEDIDYSWITRTPWDMVVMTDTFYAPHLIDPLWQTLLMASGVTRDDHMSAHPGVGGEQEASAPNTAKTTKAKSKSKPKSTESPKSDGKRKPPPIYVALERRDPRLMDLALARGKEMGFELRKINRSRLGKEVERWGWASEDWEGVEVWKCRYKG